LAFLACAALRLRKRCAPRCALANSSVAALR
jgi:hypothetical protein